MIESFIFEIFCIYHIANLSVMTRTNFCYSRKIWRYFRVLIFIEKMKNQKICSNHTFRYSNFTDPSSQLHECRQDTLKQKGKRTVVFEHKRILHFSNISCDVFEYEKKNDFRMNEKVSNWDSDVRKHFRKKNIVILKLIFWWFSL